MSTFPYRSRLLFRGLLMILGTILAPPPALAVLAPYFTDQVVFGGLALPTKVAFSPDGRVFVAEKRGTIQIFDNLADRSPTLFADLRTNVYDYEDLGLVGLTLPPGFPATPWVYVSYTYDAPIGGRAPVYGDTCAVPDSCLTSGRVSRLPISGNTISGPEQVLVNDWCQQSDTHSLGDLLFGPDGALYVGGGDGANGNQVDYGQLGSPTNPCGDPPAPVGGAMTPPTAMGGALRAQGLRSGVRTRLSGTVIRIDPATGAALADNPLAASSDANARRVVAYGLRNPFRFVFRPGSSDLYVADVGWRTWEEIDRIPTPTGTPVRNFGWPCHEGPPRQANYDATNLNLCESLYAAGAGAVTTPLYAYTHTQSVVVGDGCRTDEGAITGLAFYPKTGGNYPARYFGALFFADLERQCVWGIKPGASGTPNPGYIMPLGSTVGEPVDLAIGPDCNLYYVSITSGALRRYVYKSGSTGHCAV